MIKPDLSMPLPQTLGSVHLVGIGGAGMSAIARLFIAAGHRVTGSDRTENHSIADLRDLGAIISIGHSAANLGDADALVYTGALWPDNPEYLEAERRGIPVLHRSQALAWLIRGHRVVAVAGAHGKTTSTGMIVSALQHLGVSPSFSNGGVIQSLGTSAAPGLDDLFVIEADESDGSFLLYDTAVALVTNVDADHLDHYGDHDAFDAAFVQFCEGASGLVVLSSDDPGAVRVRQHMAAASPPAPAASGRRVITFGEDAAADVRLESVVTDGPVSFALAWDGRTYPGRLLVPGKHNAVNAAGAFAVLVGMDFDPEKSLEGIATFAGTERRFELHGSVGGVRVYDDYAHHPTEVAAALATARSVVGAGRIIAVHQPHLYTRTRAMAGDFAAVYEKHADHTIVLDVFGAREDPIPGVTGKLVSERFLDGKKVDYLPDWQHAADRAAALAHDGDIIMTLSCGDVYRIVPQIMAALTIERGQSSESAPPIKPTGSR